MGMEALATVSSGLALTGQPTYDSQIRQYSDWLNGRKPTAENVKAYLQERIEQGYAPASIANARAAIKKAIKAGTTDVRVWAAIDQAFKEIKAPRADVKVYHEEVLTLGEIGQLQEETPPRLALIIETLARTGLRISELTGARYKHCTVEGKTVYLQVLGKGSKERRVFLPLSLYKRIQNEWPEGEYLCTTTKGNRYSASYLWREIVKHGYRVLGKHVHPHSFRHSFATINIKKRGSVKAVSQYLGHSSTAITESMYHHDQLKPEDLFND